jgi:hypothetical protein
MADAAATSTRQSAPSSIPMHSVGWHVGHVRQALSDRYRRTIVRHPKPTAVMIDCQSVRTTEMGGPRGPGHP